MKFLHAADLHLDSPLRAQAARDPILGERLREASREVLTRLVDAAIAERVDAVLLAGDTFDRDVADLASRAVLAREVGRLGRAGIRTVLIQGNHDALLDMDRFGPVSDALTVLTPEAPSLRVREASIHGVGFAASHVSESLLPQYPAPERDRINIGLMHTSLNGAAGHDPYAPAAEGDLLGHGYDYWALGHIHKRAVYRGEGRLAVMPGIPQGRHVREGHGGSATLVEIDLDGVRAREVPLQLLRFVEAEVTLAGAVSQDDRDRLIRAGLAELAQDGVATAARIGVSGTAAELGDPDYLVEAVRLVAEELDGLHVERVRPAVRARDTADPEAADDLGAFMRQDATTPGFRDEVAALLAEYRDALPKEIRDVAAEDQLDALIDEGLEAMTLRLAAKGETA